MSSAIKCGLIGFGNVGQGVASIIDTNRDMISKRVGQDVDIKITEDVLTIKGERENKNINQNDYSEFTYGKFSRSFSLPDDVKQDGIKASMKDGVLALEIPRMKKVSPEIKKISIK